MKEDKRRIEEAMRSLEIEKQMKRQKVQNYRSELDKVLSQKNMMHQQQKYMSAEGKREDIMNMQIRSQKEIENETSYKNKFVQKDGKMRARQE